MDIKIKMKHRSAGETAQGIRAPNRSARGQEFDSWPPTQVLPYRLSVPPAGLQKDTQASTIHRRSTQSNRQKKKKKNHRFIQEDTHTHIHRKIKGGEI